MTTKKTCLASNGGQKTPNINNQHSSIGGIFMAGHKAVQELVFTMPFSSQGTVQVQGKEITTGGHSGLEIPCSKQDQYFLW